MWRAVLLVCGSLGPAATPDEPTPPRPASYALEWSAPEACPDRAAVQAQIEAMLPADHGGQGVLEVVGAVTQTSAGYHLQLQTRWGEQEQTRELTAAHCDALAQGATTVVVLSMVPQHSNPGPTPEVPGHQPEPRPTVPRPEVSAAPTVATSATSSSDPSPPSPTRAPTDFAAPPTPQRPAGAASPGPTATLSLRAGAEYGVLRAASAALMLRAGVRWKPASLEVHAVYVTPRRLDAPTEGRVQFGGAGVRGCWWPVDRRWGWSVCGGAEAGGLRFASSVAPGRTTTGPWFGPLASTSVILRAGRLGVVVTVEGVARVVGTRVTRESVAIFRPQFASVRGLVGLQLDFR